MGVFSFICRSVEDFVSTLLRFLWGDIIKIPFPGGKSLELSFLVLFLALSGIYFTFRTRFVQIRMIPKMFRIVGEKNKSGKDFSGLQALIVATATRVGLGNLAGVVAAISVGGAGAVFWMWIFALLGSSLAFVESTLAQLHKKEDEETGEFTGGPAFYIHDALIKDGSKRKKSIIAILFAVSGIVCWCGISQVTSNATANAMKSAFNMPAIFTSVLFIM